MTGGRRFVLWDVDGTLITTQGVGRRAMEEAALAVAGLVEVPSIVMSGKTDPQILREIFRAADLADDHIDRLLPEAMAAAERALAGIEHELRAHGRVLPGVRALLARLDAAAGVRQTLLTGNLTANAAVKVGAFDLTHFFDTEVGAYGTDHADRLELVPIALERVARFRGETYAPDEVWVIGDTPNDLACARAGGVRCLLVGTGHPEDLAALGPDAYLDDLGDVDRA
ncbi:MAG: haloacid dehalogenase-like hydrolase, partial [Acidimicrobiales bacterium]|nr:haloacid dehalogenase-like hydrolase [Acidimicrobiales bacterium]